MSSHFGSTDVNMGWFTWKHQGQDQNQNCVCLKAPLTHLYVTECSELHLSGRAPACGQQGSPHPLQGGQADGGQGGAEAEEQAEGGGHDGGVRADQGRVQQGQDVEELVLCLRPVALQRPQHLALTPDVTLFQPGSTHTRKGHRPPTTINWKLWLHISVAHTSCSLLKEHYCKLQFFVGSLDRAGGTVYLQ